MSNSTDTYVKVPEPQKRLASAGRFCWILIT